MTELTRRGAMALGAATIGASTLPLGAARAAVTDVPMADVKPPNFAIEKDATLRIMRPAKFVDPDEIVFRANTKAFTDKTGIPVRVDFVSWEDVLPQTAVTANTGAGPDVIVGFSSAPQIYASKLVGMTDLADYLGAKYGGWFNLAQLYGKKWGSQGLDFAADGRRHRPVRLSVSWLKEAGYDTVPNDSRLPGDVPEAEEIRPSGRLLAGSRAGGCERLRATGCCGSHNAYLVDENSKIALELEGNHRGSEICRRSCRRH